MRAINRRLGAKEGVRQYFHGPDKSNRGTKDCQQQSIDLSLASDSSSL